AGSPALSVKAHRFRPQRRTQSAEPRQIRICADFMARGDQTCHRRDQSAKARIRSGRDRVFPRLASHLGKCRLLPLGAVPVRQCRRHDAHPPQSGLLGGYWGAVHHWGYTLRVGQSETYGTVEDCLRNCDMIVFWAADPESTSGSYGAQEGTTRRQWLKDAKLGIKVVHVDPYYNASAQFLPGKWF